MGFFFASSFLHLAVGAALLSGRIMSSYLSIPKQRLLIQKKKNVAAQFVGCLYVSHVYKKKDVRLCVSHGGLVWSRKDVQAKPNFRFQLRPHVVAMHVLTLLHSPPR